ncbi:MAG: DUF1587 domain-containing protein [Planctomycetales bacterium]
MTAEPVLPSRIRDLHLKRRRCRCLVWASVLVVGIGFGGIWTDCLLPVAYSQDSISAQDDPSGKVADRFFAKHCRTCHAGPKPKGDFQLSSLTPDFSNKDARSAWLAVLEQVESRNMPPVKRPRPTSVDVRSLTAWIKQRVATAEADHSAAQGRVVLRRLNRNEYVNTLCDLLDVKIDLKDLLPLSTSTSGFGNSAEALHVSTYLMESYLAAADRALDAAIANGPRSRTQKQRLDIKDERTVRATGSVYRHLDDGVAIFSTSVAANIQVTLWQFMSRHPGKYRFRI